MGVRSPDQDFRQRRLEELATKQFKGADELGVALQLKNGNYVRQMIRGHRAISEKTIRRIEALRGGRFKGWFDPSATTAPSPAAGPALVAEEPLHTLYALPPEIRRLLDDLADLPPAKQSRFIDAIHQEAEEARQAAAHLASRRATTRAARRGGSNGGAAVTIAATLGDGNPRQTTLPLFVTEDPFRDEPSEPERAFYKRIERHPK